jgi:hypothetical protein
VDDILLVYNKTKTNIHDILSEFNKIHHNLQFTLEHENNNTINFLDVSISRKVDKLEFNIYRKPTITSTVIHASSCHPIENKKTAFNYLLNRAEKYPLSSTNRKAKLNIIKQIARENEYDNSILSKKTHKKQDINPLDTPSVGNTQHDTKWVTFTYIGKETKHITKLFRHWNKNCL